MRKDKLDQDGVYQNHLKQYAWNVAPITGDNSKQNFQEHFHVLVGRINELNTYTGREMRYAYETDIKDMHTRNMLFQANFTLDFGFLKPGIFNDVFWQIEEWVLNEKALFCSEVTLHDDDGKYHIEGLLNTDAEIEDDRYIICTVFDYNLASALHIFLNWFHAEISHYASIRNVR